MIRLLRNLVLFFAGSISFIICEIIWLRNFADLYATKWILEPTAGIFLCFILLILTGTIFGYLFIKSFSDIFSFLFGVWLAITRMLFYVGQGNLWPIVLIIDYIIITPIAIVGCFIGFRISQKQKMPALKLTLAFIFALCFFYIADYIFSPLISQISVMHLNQLNLMNGFNKILFRIISAIFYNLSHWIMIFFAGIIFSIIAPTQRKPFIDACILGCCSQIFSIAVLFIAVISLMHTNLYGSKLYFNILVVIFTTIIMIFSSFFGILFGNLLGIKLFRDKCDLPN